MTEDWYISTHYRGTCWVQTNRDVIVDAAKEIERLKEVKND